MPRTKNNYCLQLSLRFKKQMRRKKTQIFQRSRKHKINNYTIAFFQYCIINNILFKSGKILIFMYRFIEKIYEQYQIDLKNCLLRKWITGVLPLLAIIIFYPLILSGLSSQINVRPEDVRPEGGQYCPLGFVLF